jgi:hypothetical protein
MSRSRLTCSSSHSGLGRGALWALALLSIVASGCGRPLDAELTASAAHPTPTPTVTKPPAQPAAVRAVVPGAYGSGVAVLVARTDASGKLAYTVELIGDESRRSVLASRPDLSIDTSASDGSRLALGLVNGDERSSHLLVVTPAQNVSEIDLGTADWVDDWRFWGDIAPVADGGFVLTGIDRLVIVGSDGSVRSEALPPGWIIQAPTSDPDVFLVGALGDDNGAEARTPAATGLYLYRRSTGNVASEPASLVQIDEIASSSTGLAYLRAFDGRWLRLGDDLRLAMASEPTEASTWISPDGTLLAVEATPAQRPCVADAECSVYLVDLLNGNALRQGPGPAGSDIVFGNQSITYVTGGTDPLQVVTVRAGDTFEVGL